MIRIKRGNTELTVTRGAYKAMYAHAGFTPIAEEADQGQVDQEQEPPQSEEATEEPEDEEDSYDEDPSEKPLSEMTFSDLRNYAKRLGIRVDGVRTRRELKQAILRKQR